MVRPLMRVVLFAEGTDNEGKPVSIAYQVSRATVQIEHGMEDYHPYAGRTNGPRIDSQKMTVSLEVDGTLVGGVMFADPAIDIPAHLRLPRLHLLSLYESGADGWTCLFPNCKWSGSAALTRDEAETRHDGWGSTG